MGAILGRVIRIRKIREQLAQQELAEKQGVMNEHARALEALHARVSDSAAESVGGGAEGLSRHHAFALRSEMQRRRREAELRRAQAALERQRAQLQHVARDRQAAEELHDIQLQQEAEVSMQKDQRQLDDMASLGWQRRQGKGGA